MILPDFVLPSRVNQRWAYSGMDSYETCFDKHWFENYPYAIEYCYNNRGYRDREWPDQAVKLKQSIWCLGDSFTVGLGSPVDHIWPRVLESLSNIPTINVSMDGASNQWLARRSCQVLDTIDPEYMIIHWSYVSRREASADGPYARSAWWTDWYQQIRKPNWPDCAYRDRNSLPTHILSEINLPDTPDEYRRIICTDCSTEQDIENTLMCIEQVNRAARSTQVIHSFIPKFVRNEFRGTIESQLTGSFIPELEQLDRARDGHHYGFQTSEYFCQRIIELMQ